MGEPGGDKPSRDALRRRAERAVDERSKRRPRDQRSAKSLLHELQVHQVELEMQNKSLQDAQEALEESRDRYRLLFELAPVGYLTLDRRGRVVEANRAAGALLGRSPSKLVGTPLAGLLDRDQADRLHIHLQDAIAGGGKRSIEIGFPAPGGRKAVRVDSVAVTDAGGKRVGWRSVLVDRTELRDAKEGLRASEARSSSLFETVSDAVVCADAEGRIESFNRAAERLFGYRREEAVGQDVGLLMPSPFREEHESYMRRYLETGEGRIIGRTSLEVRGRRRDGSEFPLELGLGEWWDRGERKFVAVLHDLTERKIAERDIRESEARFRQIADHVADVFLLRQRSDGRVLYANPAFEKVWGRPVTALYDDPAAWLAWVYPEDRGLVLDAVGAATRGESLDVHHRIRRPDGEVRWVRVRSFPVGDDDVRKQRDVLVMQDVTSEHRLEDELAQAQKMEAVGALASGVAHDFNNVLQAVVSCLNLARDERTPADEARYLMARAEDAARRGGDLANQLMSFARKKETAPVPVVLDSLVRGSASLISRLVTEQVRLDIETGAPRCALVADAVQIEQILLNLAANARDAMPEGGTLSIRTEIDVGNGGGREAHAGNGHRIRLIVADTGIGIDEETRAHIFEPFFTTKEVGKGTGLGLSTVGAVTRRLGGYVEVDSEPGHGTTFVFSFPCASDRVGTAARPVTQPIQLSGTALLIEDEPLIRSSVSQYLEDLGLDVLEARDSDEALDLCDAHGGPVDVLVSDVILPTMAGPRIAMLLRERYPDLRVLFITADPESSSLEGPMAEVPTLRKPFGGEELSAALSELFGLDLHQFPGGEERGGEPEEAEQEPRRGDKAAPLTALLVEDDEGSREALLVLLESQGYQVLAAEEAAEALQIALGDEPIDVIIADVRLPGMDGAELADRLRRIRAGVPIVFMSGLSSPPPGGDAFVQKPVDFETLLATIEKLL